MELGLGAGRKADPWGEVMPSWCHMRHKMSHDLHMGRCMLDVAPTCKKSLLRRCRFDLHPLAVEDVMHIPQRIKVWRGGWGAIVQVKGWGLAVAAAQRAPLRRAYMPSPDDETKQP